MPHRGYRPGTTVLSQTWTKHDNAKLQKIRELTFAFAIPHGYTCEELAQGTVACGHGFTSKSAYVYIQPSTCGCTLAQVTKIVDNDLSSKQAYRRLLPVDPFTRVSDYGNGKAKYQYWMSRVYGTHRGRIDHHVLVYGQANNHTDAVKIRKIIGDIYDATRQHS